MKTDTKKINVKLLRRVKAQILEEPRRLDMDFWAAKTQGRKESPPCGTVACIAGWACILDYEERTGVMPKGRDFDGISRNAGDVATKLLGLNEEQAARLFDPPAEPEDDYDNEYDEPISENLWPADLVEAYLDAETPLARARVAAKRIERFIKTNGAE